MMTRRLLTAIAALPVLALPAEANPVSRDQVLAAVTQIRAMAEDLIASGEVPGFAIGVVHDDEVVWTGGFGVRRAGSADPIDADTVFQLASLSKPISATVIAALVGQDLLDWNSLIRDLDPAFVMHDPYATAQVTIRDMLGHLSGIPGSAGNDLEAIGFDRDTIMHRLRFVQPWVSLRGGYSYSNAAFTQGGLAAARAANADWETVAQQYLLEPLGMASSSFRYEDFQGHENAASLHVRWQEQWDPLVTRDPAPQAPAGSATSSVNDMTRWMRMVLANGSLDGKPVVKGAALAQAHAPLTWRGKNPITGATSFYGIGWAIELDRHGPIWAHAGAFSDGALTVVKLVPDSNIGIVVLSNGFPNAAPDALADSFLDLAIDGALARDYIGPWRDYYGGMFGPQIEAAKAKYATRPTPATSARPVEAYSGRYHNDYVGDAIVEAEGDRLVLVIGPGGKTRLPMTHFDRDMFTYFPDHEMPDRPSAISFALDHDGRARAITIENLDANDLGTLERVD